MDLYTVSTGVLFYTLATVVIAWPFIIVQFFVFLITWAVKKYKRSLQSTDLHHTENVASNVEVSSANVHRLSHERRENEIEWRRDEVERMQNQIIKLNSTIDQLNDEIAQKDEETALDRHMFKRIVLEAYFMKMDLKEICHELRPEFSEWDKDLNAENYLSTTSNMCRSLQEIEHRKREIAWRNEASKRLTDNLATADENIDQRMKIIDLIAKEIEVTKRKIDRLETEIDVLSNDCTNHPVNTEVIHNEPSPDVPGCGCVNEFSAEVTFTFR
jgi:septal ring factor EnvC (AmiA/AmiB activator)